MAPRSNGTLADGRQRTRVYEIASSEGTDDDIRRFIDVDQLVDLWDDLWLAPHVPSGLGRPHPVSRRVRLRC